MKTINYTHLKLDINSDIYYPCQLINEETFITTTHRMDMDGLFFLNNDLLTEYLTNGNIYIQSKLIFQTKGNTL